MGGPKKKKPGQAGAAKKAEPQIVPHRNIYVGNLAGMEMTQEKLSDLFKACGEVTMVQFVAEPLPPAKNPFGFVEFATVEEASSAIEKLHGESGMIVKYANTLSDGTNAPKELPSTHSREEAVVEDAKEGQTEEASGDEKPEVACTALVHPDPVGAARRDYPNPVENLQALVQKAIREGSSIRDHIIYTVEEVEEDFGALIATIELRLPAGCHTSRGEPKDNKKEATKSAAQVALRNPEVHRLLPPLPPKVREVKASKAEHSEDEEEEVASTACTEKLSVKKQRQLQKEEIRAKRQAKRNAVKAIKAALAAEESDDDDEEEESEDGEDSTREDSEDQEESEEEDIEDSSDEDEDSLVCVNAAELASKMKAIKERIGSQSRKRDGKSALSTKKKDKSGLSKAEKAAQKGQMQTDTKDIGIEVVFTSAWSATGAKTNYVKP